MCWGFEHSAANAALIGTIAEAFQKDELLFLAEAEHIRYVKNILDKHSITVRYSETTIPPRALLEKHQRFVPDFRLYRNVFGVAHKNHANRIIFCSVMSPGIISIKALLRRYRDIICLVVLHHALQDVIKRPSLRPHHLFFWLRFWLSFGNTHRLRYVVLGPRIEDQLKQYVPRASSYVSSIDLPYFFKDDCRTEPFAHDVIRFGSYGVGSFQKGTDIFFRLAEEIQSIKTTYRPTFTLVGYIWDKQLKAVPHASVYTPSLDFPMDQEAYETSGRNIDYALVFNRPDAYELRASAAIYDAFSFLKPIIAMKSPLTEYYFKQMGDIGYLCENRSAVKETILNVLETRPFDRYRQQQENIRTQRVQFSPVGLSLKFRSLF